MSPDTMTIITDADNTGSGQTGQEQVPPLTPPAEGAREGEGQTEQIRLKPQEGANVALGEFGIAKPEGPLNMGMNTVEMPSEAQQRAGFKVENPGVLVAQFPQYKLFVAKGE